MDVLQPFAERSYWLSGRSTWDLAVEASLDAYLGDDPDLEAPVPASLRRVGGGLLSPGGIPYAEPPRLAPDWQPRYPQGFLFAEDLLMEGLEQLLAGDVLATRAKLECALAVLERMPKDREAVSTACVVVRLRECIELLRCGRPLEARLRLAPLVKKALSSASSCELAA